MVREARTNGRDSFRKLLILGLGTHHRLGELVVLRTVKDHLILNQGKVAAKLAIDVFDREADAWLTTLRGRFPQLDQVCTITAHPCWARKIGCVGIDHDYDAAFVCISDEGHATAQAVMLRRDVLTNGQQIMVRVTSIRLGYGRLLGTPDSGWGDNVHAVGLEDPLYGPDTATQPELELRAQAIHYYVYRALQKNSQEDANKPWNVLAETFREANRKLAERYAAHLASTDGTLKTKRYRWVFRSDGFLQLGMEQFLFQFSTDELESLAGREHTLWKEEREAQGWRYGPVKDQQAKTNSLLVDYTQLTDEATREYNREYNREFVRRIPLILALADYTIVEES